MNPGKSKKVTRITGFHMFCLPGDERRFSLYSPAMPNRSAYFPALIITGLLTGVLSSAPVVSCCCFLWAALGGMFAVKLISGRGSTEIEALEGMTIGLINGVIATLLAAIVHIVVSQFTNMNFNADPQLQEMLTKNNIDPKLLASGVGLCISGAVIISMSLVGGLLGVAFWGRRR